MILKEMESSGKSKINNQNNKPESSKAVQNASSGKSLEQQAVEEILREINIKSIRAKEIGPTGWLDSPIKRTNKRFLGNTLKAAVKHNTRKEYKEKFESEKKLLEMDYTKHPSRKPKFGDRKFVFKKPGVEKKPEPL